MELAVSTDSKRSAKLWWSVCMNVIADDRKELKKLSHVLHVGVMGKRERRMLISFSTSTGSSMTIDDCADENRLFTVL